MNELKIIMK